ncbi:MAG: small subunit ribosomal protein S11 [Candidatus Promineifilaceae bacterium]|jgi:small subunit ribosomal protein S11
MADEENKNPETSETKPDAEAAAPSADAKADKVEKAEAPSAKAKADKVEKAEAPSAKAKADKVEKAEAPSAKAKADKVEKAEAPSAKAKADKVEKAEAPSTDVKADKVEKAAAPSEEAKAEGGVKAEASPTPEPEAEDTTARDLLSADAGAEPIRKVRGKGRQVASGVAHIRATFNNTMVTITDPRGGVVAWSNAGRAGFKGSRKSTSFAATLVGQDAARQAIGRGMHEVEVRVQGAGSGRESAVRALQSSGLNITVIKDVTPIPHNGCRPRKRRRV